ncbi:hypothetical protein Kpol_183p2 [Vanderwaltozyma polyspora DSM 70294]|uniref:DNA mismatch repair protein MSH3 n=1 Tax=Vanderwaltozyma polyspora (strain ATCC 22028 / DSM 70294 / BCRC 21397 / CBS 2163 / NBRC 10782 / NRRL Y-8283 / UCD 57-17) TaxID=436907 RepID=MSH3_VANPO|nr:uncharacterized protein Kpol_183p2 [Vanderwaltozyma polyspora DSM 70294]A7TTQ1.1 RecName: Full=DNA mismatch repair protein MSH3; AltName: Full=MutS protein homolog 3 [Vanderwaltozyma polyspora DSM 70294]EDO14357.1 hypothetical protein Kpol_183p2 [Vanderwaltozyma polyspora DSM 70294]
MSKQPVISRFFKPIARKEVTSEKGVEKEKPVDLDEEKHNEPATTSRLMPKGFDAAAETVTDEVIEIEVEIEHESEPKIEIKNGTVTAENKSMDFAEKLNRIWNDKKRVISNNDNDDSDGENDTIVKKSKNNSNKLTPLDQQVKDLKLLHMDKILVIRVGYKYKCFAQDAEIVSKILHIMLIPGKLTIDESNPQDSNYRQFAYCSFPDIRLKVHLETLVHNNLKVAVVEQSETSAIKKNSNASSKNSVFERKISGVYTKATFGINSAFSSNRKNVLGQYNSIWIINFSEIDKINSSFFMISVNLNSGEIIYDTFECSTTSIENLETRIKYLNPIEVLTVSALPEKVKLRLHGSNSTILLKEKEDIDKEIMEEINKSTKGLNLSAELFELVPVLYKYLTEYNNEELLLISENYKPFASKKHMVLNAAAIESLGIFGEEGGKGSLFWLLDHTRTSFGSRKLREWILHPLLDKKEIEDRLDAVDCIIHEVSNIFFESLNKMLTNVPDLLRTINRIAYGTTSRKEIYYFLKQMKSFSDHFQLHSNYLNSQVVSNDGRIHKSSALLTNLLTEITSGLKEINIENILSMINVSSVMEKDTYKQVSEFFNLNYYDHAEEIIKIQGNINEVKNELAEELSSIRKILKRPHLNYKDEMDYLIEVRNTQTKGLPSDWIVVNRTKMISRYHTPTSRKLIEKLQYQKDILYQETQKEYFQFVKRIKNDYFALNKIINHIATYDCILALASTSQNMNYVRPVLTDESQFIDAKNARNPIIESLDINYVPNDVNLSHSAGKFLIITGPNMGGKSSYIRQVALLVILAQVGSYVPADFMKTSIFDKILTRIGAYDNLLKGQSTFKVELLEIQNIIKNKTENSLLLLDEVGRGTSTEDGKAISYSIVDYFINLPVCPLVLFTTHYPFLGSINSKILKSYYMDFVEQKKEGEDWPSIVFLYKLRSGITDSSFGLNVARLAQIDKDIINHAFSISEKIRQETETANTMNLPILLKHILSSNDLKPQQKIIEILNLQNDSQEL